MSATVEKILGEVRSLNEIERAEFFSAIEREIEARRHEEHCANVDRIMGKYAGLPGSVDAFLECKREDLERE